MTRGLLLIAIVLFSVTGVVFWAVSVKTLTIYPDKDSYSWQSVPLANNGHSDNFEITSYDKPPYNMRGWIEFSITSIPSDALLLSAQLRLRLWTKSVDDASQNMGDSTGRIYAVYRITQPWTETGVNWANQPNFTDVHHATSPVPAGEGGWYGPLFWMVWDIGDIMRDWRSGAPNYGLVVRDAQENSPVFYTTQFFTHDQVPNETYYPRLVVTYISPLSLGIFGGTLVAEGFIMIIANNAKPHRKDGS